APGDTAPAQAGVGLLAGSVAPTLELALELADLADAITLPRFGATDLVVATKPDLTPVSDADRAAERAIRRRLADVCPGDAVLGEEFGPAPGEEPATNRR